jgi:hypothetical protein
VAQLSWPMYLEGIGELTEHHGYWRLVYERCGHSLELAHAGLEDPQQAEAYIRRGLAECLSCRAAAAVESAEARQRNFLELLERSASEQVARFGSDKKRRRRRRRRR